MRLCCSIVLLMLIFHFGHTSAPCSKSAQDFSVSSTYLWCKKKKKRNREVFSRRGSTVGRGYDYSFYFNSKLEKKYPLPKRPHSNSKRIQIAYRGNKKIKNSLGGDPMNPSYERGKSLLPCSPPLSCLWHSFLYSARPLFITWRRDCRQLESL